MTSNGSASRPLGKLFVVLQEKTQKIIHDSNYPADDVRHLAFLQCLGIIQPDIMVLNTIYTSLENQIPENMYPALFGIKKEWKEQQFGALERFVQYSSIIMFNFVLENFLKNLLAKLEKSDPPRQISKTTQKLLYSISIVNPQNKINVLLTLGHIRNSFHSNGIHENESTQQISLSGELFEFIKGQPILHTNWIRMHHLLDEIITIMDEIISTKEIKAISEKIEGRFITQ